MLCVKINANILYFIFSVTITNIPQKGKTKFYSYIG